MHIVSFTISIMSEELIRRVMVFPFKFPTKICMLVVGAFDFCTVLSVLGVRRPQLLLPCS
jgi:hypothetical protein